MTFTGVLITQFCLHSLSQSISVSKKIYTAPNVTSISEAQVSMKLGRLVDWCVWNKPLHTDKVQIIDFMASEIT